MAGLREYLLITAETFLLQSMYASDEVGPQTGRLCLFSLSEKGCLVYSLNQ